MFERVSEHFPNLWDVKWCKTCVLSLNALLRGTEHAKMVSQRKQPFYPIWPQMIFDGVSEHFPNLWDVKRCKTFVSNLNAQSRHTELAKMVSQRKQPFYPIRPQTLFEIVLEHFPNRWDVKRCKTCLSSQNILLRGIVLAKIVSKQKQPFYHIRPQTMYERVSEHFPNISDLKWCKTCVSGPNALFRGTKLAKMVS